MRKLLPIVAISLILAWLGDAFSEKHIDRLGNVHYIRKNRLAFILIAVSMAVFVGLRTNYNDTSTYRHSYGLINTELGLTENFNWSLGANPGYNLLNRIIKHAGFSTQSYLMFYAFVTISIYIWFVRKYSTDLLFTMFLFITMGCFGFTAAAIKQCAAVAFCLVATDCAIHSKYVPFVAWVLIAATFHPYSLMYLMVPILSFRPWCRKGYFMVMFFVAIGFMLQSLIGTILDVTTMIGEGYSDSSFVGEGVNIFRVAVVWVPVVLSWMARNCYENDGSLENRTRNVITNLATLNACIMFVGLFGTANYFARLANYFLIFQALALPGILVFYRNQERLLLESGAVIGYSGYFYYAMVLAHKSFDSQFKSIGLWEYLSSIL